VQPKSAHFLTEVARFSISRAHARKREYDGRRFELVCDVSFTGCARSGSGLRGKGIIGSSRRQKRQRKSVIAAAPRR